MQHKKHTKSLFATCNTNQIVQQKTSIYYNKNGQEGKHGCGVLTNMQSRAIKFIFVFFIDDVSDDDGDNDNDDGDDGDDNIGDDDDDGDGGNEMVINGNI